MAKEERHNEESLAAVCEKAWRDFPLVKILRAFEMRSDVAFATIHQLDSKVEQEVPGKTPPLGELP